MSRLQQEIELALKDALKAKDKPRRDALRLLQSAIKQVEIDRRARLNDEDILDILRLEAKRRREAITELTAAGRAESAEQERLELALTEQFLPRQLSADELRPIIAAAIRETGASTVKDMGAVMRAVLPQVRNQADGKLVSTLVRKMLG